MQVNGEKLQQAVPLHAVLHKPPGLLVTAATNEGPTVFDILPDEWRYRTPPLHAIGRLDRMTSGLLLLTQSGELTERLLSERRRVRRVYVCRLQRPISPGGAEVGAFASGALELVDGHVCRPARLEVHPGDPHLARVTVWEGRYHQVRRMFAAVGNRVLQLRRVRFGELSLDGLGLREGESRALTASELYALLLSTERRRSNPRLLRQLAAMEDAGALGSTGTVQALGTGAEDAGAAQLAAAALLQEQGQGQGNASGDPTASAHALAAGLLGSSTSEAGRVGLEQSSGALAVREGEGSAGALAEWTAGHGGDLGADSKAALGAGVMLPRFQRQTRTRQASQALAGRQGRAGASPGDSDSEVEMKGASEAERDSDGDGSDRSKQEGMGVATGPGSPMRQYLVDQGALPDGAQVLGEDELAEVLRSRAEHREESLLEGDEVV